MSVQIRPSSLMRIVNGSIRRGKNSSSLIKGLMLRSSSSTRTVEVREYPSSANQHQMGRVLIYSATSHDSQEPGWEKRRSPIQNVEDSGDQKGRNRDRDLGSFLFSSISHFLPAKYPESVAPGYFKFASYCFIASVSGSAAMVLSTQTLLLAVGVAGTNAQQASVMAGAFNWVLKDFVGQLGGVLFASQMGKTRAFDSDPKRWRMTAALALDAATLMEILSPLCYPSMVLIVASVANVFKNIGFLTASASRAALHQAVARTGNLGDVTAKAGSQSIMASLIGTSLGIGFSALLGHDVYNFTAGFCALTVIHQGCNYVSLKHVPLNFFNGQRLQLVVQHYTRTGTVLSPNEVSRLEAFLPFQSTANPPWLKIGSPLVTLCPNPNDLGGLLKASTEESYLLNLKSPREVHLTYFRCAEGTDLIRGILHAHLAYDELANASKDVNVVEENSSTDTTMTIGSSHKESVRLIPEFMEKLQEEGWRTDTNLTTIESNDAYRISIDR